MTKLKPPTDVRAASLLQRLDNRYVAFVGSLPPLLAQRAVRYGTFAGRPSDEPLGRLSRMNAVVACLPWLFWESFCQLPDDLFLQIAEAGALYGMASVLLDHLIDGQADSSGETALLRQALYAAGMAGYRRIFPAASGFWVEFDRLADEHLSGMTLEVAGRIDPTCLTAEAFYRLASARITPMITTIAALASLLDRPGLLPSAEASIKAVIVAGQLLDDIGDWEEDLLAGRVTYYLARLLPLADSLAPETSPAERVRQTIAAHWEDVNGLREVLDWFAKGLAAVEGLQCAAWVEYIEEYQAVTQRLLTAAITDNIVEGLRPLAAAEDS